MTQLLDRAIAAARRLPPEAQDEIARSLLLLTGEDSEPVRLTDEERLAVAEGRAAVAAGQFASDEEVAAIFAKHRA